MPTPPATCNAPVVEDIDSVVPDSVRVFWNVGPLDDVPLLTKISPSVPGPVKAVTPEADWNTNCPVVPPVRLLAELAVPLRSPTMVPPTCRSRPMPTPPNTVNAPLTVDIEFLESVISTGFWNVAVPTALTVPVIDRSVFTVPVPPLAVMVILPF
jgi:hypothetical protein